MPCEGVIAMTQRFNIKILSNSFREASTIACIVLQNSCYSSSAKTTWVASCIAEWWCFEVSEGTIILNFLEEIFLNQLTFVWRKERTCRPWQTTSLALWNSYYTMSQTSWISLDFAKCRWGNWVGWWVITWHICATTHFLN